MLGVIVYTLMLVFISFLGLICSKKNIILMLVEIELLLLAANFNFINIAYIIDDVTGCFWSLILLTLAGVEAAIGLTLLIIYYRLRGVIFVSLIVAVKG